jgi:hypothetical protein
MLTIPHILRLIEAEAYGRLIERVLANGRCDSPDICRRLSRPDVRVPAALGLALQRCVELSYSPTAVAGALVGRLLDQQRGDGLFGSASHESQLIATAVALRSLADLPLPPGEGKGEGVTDSTLNSAINEARDSLAHLANAIDWLALSPVAAAIALWQLGDRPNLRGAWSGAAWANLARCAESTSAPRSLHRFALAFAA